MELTQRDLIDLAIYAQYKDELYHHGILGMKWGVRRYQNEDGSLTPEGQRRYKENSYASRLANTNMLTRQTSAQMIGGPIGQMAVMGGNIKTAKRLENMSDEEARNEEAKIKESAKKGRNIASGLYGGILSGTSAMALGALTGNPVVAVGAGVVGGLLGGVGGVSLSNSSFDKTWNKNMERYRYTKRSKKELEEYDREHQQG
jgi:hypothetical protein